MADSTVDKGKLQQALEYRQEDLRNVDAAFLQYAALGGAHEVFDRNLEKTLTTRPETLPTLHVGAAVGAMLLRAEAKFPGAEAEFNARKKEIANVTTAKAGGVMRYLITNLGEQHEGSGSILGVYLATNAADDRPDYSIWHQPPSLGVAKMFKRKVVEQGGDSSSHVQHYEADAAGDARRYLTSYLSSAHGIRTSTPEGLLAGGYGAVMVRSGALRRALNMKATADKRVALCQVEDFVSAMNRIGSGQGEAGVIAELNSQEVITWYELGAEVLKYNGKEARGWFGVGDAVRRASKTARGAFKSTTVSAKPARPGATPAPEEPKEHPDLTEGGVHTDRAFKKTVGGKGHIPTPDEIRAASEKKAPSGQGSRQAQGPRLATPGRTERPPQNTSPAPRAAGTPPTERITPPVPQRRSLRTMLTGGVNHMVQELTRDRANYNNGAALFAGLRMRIAANRASEEEQKAYAKTETLLAKLSMRQMKDICQRMAAGEPMQSADFAAATETRRWLMGILTGERTVNGIDHEMAETYVNRILHAQQVRLSQEYGIPAEELRGNIRLTEALNEIFTTEITRVHEDAPRNWVANFVGRVNKYLTGEEWPTLEYDLSTSQFTRIRTHLRDGIIHPSELPPRAREQYNLLNRQLGFLGMPAQHDVQWGKIGENLMGYVNKGKRWLKG